MIPVVNLSVIIRKILSRMLQSIPVRQSVSIVKQMAASITTTTVALQNVWKSEVTLLAHVKKLLVQPSDQTVIARQFRFLQVFCKLQMLFVLLKC